MAIIVVTYIYCAHNVIFLHLVNKNMEAFGCYVILAFLLTKYNFHTASGIIRNKMCNFVS